MRTRPWATAAAAALAAGSVAALLVLTVAGGAGASGVSYPRSQTLITSGTQWGNIAGTNPYVGNYAAGTVGLVNETLLRFDPLKDRYIDWLAKSAKWTGAKQYTVVVRSGVKWADGRAFTGNDVKYNVTLGHYKTAFWNNLWLNLKSIKVKANTVVFNFKGTPNYVQWQNLMWNLPMISPAQARPLIKSGQDLTTYSPRSPVGTGPYRIDTTGWDPTTRVVFVKKASWWAAKQHLSPSPKPKYIVDLVNTSNTNSLSAVLTGVEDLNNNFLPGVDKLVKQGKVLTYFKKAPYMLSANTAWLEPNTTHKPLNDPVFRRALALACNMSQYARQAEANLVRRGIFHLPIIKSGTGQTFANFERYSNPKAWSLVKQLDRTPPTNKARIMSINHQLQTVLMQKLPVIPMWYNGVWAQFTSKYWTGWPSSQSHKYMPAMWRGYLQMTGIDMITHLKPAK